jgi:hypothetical protein
MHGVDVLNVTLEGSQDVLGQTQRRKQKHAIISSEAIGITEKKKNKYCN